MDYSNYDSMETSNDVITEDLSRFLNSLEPNWTTFEAANTGSADPPFNNSPFEYPFDVNEKIIPPSSFLSGPLNLLAVQPVIQSLPRLLPKPRIAQSGIDINPSSSSSQSQKNIQTRRKGARKGVLACEVCRNMKRLVIPISVYVLICEVRIYIRKRALYLLF